MLVPSTGRLSISAPTTTGPGYVIIQNTAPSTTISGGINVGKVGVEASGAGPITVTTTTCIGGKCSDKQCTADNETSTR